MQSLYLRNTSESHTKVCKNPKDFVESFQQTKLDLIMFCTIISKKI